ncbi:hypothetical protein LPB136_10865 [Tenacibaculum todarodis]|uniref:GLPGLI family protein n=1 Tax=Tenacibaculum todarodis TaxID=1850252 RepID=A0A1L3JL73_9FLAO|nr:GLPGLI family protein [Tenacibaculum todarodis]APG65834.1 hypothetical protein LPB136_10865 [Tenacibaculum todarodis]
MKKYFTLLFSFAVFICCGQNINYEFTYNVSVQADATDINSTYKENMTLFVSKTESIYISPIKIIVDSARIAIKKRGGSLYELSEIKKKHPKNRIQSSIKKRYRTKETTYQKKVLAKTIEIKEKVPSFNWKIANETSTILGYKCQLALLAYKGRNYKAWFSTAIPIQDGPWKFYGLPGLIFKISDNKNHYSFTLKEIKKGTGKIPKQLTKNLVIQTTSKNYNKAVKGILNEFANKAIGETRVRLKRDFKKIGEKGNPIELED